MEESGEKVSFTPVFSPEAHAASAAFDLKANSWSSSAWFSSSCSAAGRPAVWWRRLGGGFRPVCYSNGRPHRKLVKVGLLGHRPVAVMGTLCSRKPLIYSSETLHRGSDSESGYKRPIGTYRREKELPWCLAMWYYCCITFRSSHCVYITESWSQQ